MTFSEIAGRLLKGSGHLHAPDRDTSIENRPFLGNESALSFLASSRTDSGQTNSCGGMVANDFGEPKGQPGNPSSWAKIRPLSDIRELTEPSLAEPLSHKPLSDRPSRSASRPDLSRKPSVASRRRPSLETRNGENREPDRKFSLESNGMRSVQRGRTSRTPSPPSPADNHSISSIYTIPPGNVPPRSSSRTRARSPSRTRAPTNPVTFRVPANNTMITLPQLPPPSLTRNDNTIPRHGQSQSPLRHVAARHDPILHDTNRRIPSRTFVREPLSKELLEFPSHLHPRIELGLDLLARIFVGGGSIEGTVQINVDDAERIRHRRTLDIARISIDLLGLEEMSDNRRNVFLNLATELIDKSNPPPANMVDTQDPISSLDLFWHLMPSVTNLAFNLSLPLNVGPLPFHSRHASIRYVLCVSLLIRDRGKQYIVRTSEDVTVLSVYDPEKALMSLPSPLTASDEWLKQRATTIEIIRVTAGLHRQVWVSGTSIYVDVHVCNNSRKNIKRIELQLERDILCYKHAAASTMEKSAGQARIFDSNERTILSRSNVKSGNVGWHGVPCHATHIRTCDLELPRGHATVKCGKYFEVRYFLNVIVSSAHTKLVTVQLPIVLIHMNSLDVVPNSVAQVAMAIEEKRAAHSHRRGQCSPHLKRIPTHPVQGRAFAAPRIQSIERMRARADDIQELGVVLDHSPRKYSLHRIASDWDYRTPPSNRKGRIVGDGEVADLRDRLRRARSNTTTSAKEHLHRDDSTKSRRGTTSALGFREAEIRDDIELGGMGGITGEASFKQRLEQSRERQYRFSKKRSMERWRGVASVGVGWLKGSAGVKDEDERDEWV
ncbi:hypothetical protein DE146DRAFT_780714 [Phaeosphaeria sp. MPI-PUGE-AT-0046c]|nr:hypothetical protein DE146DRAFT_780714 [Phaeosphaeria sp. MPI-PUGE-AT-0046c]